MAEASGNSYLTDALQNLGPALISMPRERLQTAAPGTSIGPVSLEHRAVLDAVAAGDALAAAAAMRMHFAGSRHRLEAVAGTRN
ncbi:DNA-binding FadR family transcriptional regulator [Arthrobacter sp. UYP6]|uniref:FCD domain-containing protein n=1 Tax=Arthrobacter sp. UYP6 TaxID=1756378 RepID=UPI00339A963E